MSAPTGAPSHGVRFELVLRHAEAGGALYEGLARTTGAELALRVSAERAGARAELTGAERPANAEALEKLAAALVRAATRVELEEGLPVPHKIVRWRAL